MENIRCFLAIRYPPEVLQRIETYQQTIRPFFPDRSVGWTTRGNLHLTLKFYGEVSLNQVERMKEIIQNSVKEYPAFSFHAQDSGVFPNPERARILWIGATPGSQLIDLARRVDSLSREINVEQEKKPFSPHLTIGRIRDGFSKSVIDPAIKTYLAHPAGDLGCVFVDQIVLIRSELLPSGAKYSPIQEFSLSEQPITWDSLC